jgi:hypothetical protein
MKRLCLMLVALVAGLAGLAGLAGCAKAPTGYIALVESQRVEDTLGLGAVYEDEHTMLFYADSLEILGNPLSPEAARVGKVVCIAVPQPFIPGVLRVGMQCRLFIGEYRQPGSQSWEGTAGYVEFWMQDSTRIRARFSATVEDRQAPARTVRYEGSLSFDGPARPMAQAPPEGWMFLAQPKPK